MSKQALLDPLLSVNKRVSLSANNDTKINQLENTA